MRFQYSVITATILLHFVSSHLYNGSPGQKEKEEVAARIFGFAESLEGCSRPPNTKKEKIIGHTFQLLCKHFGPETRDDIVDSIQISKIKITETNLQKLYNKCFDKLKPKFMACFEEIFDRYDLVGSEQPPACLNNLAVFPSTKYQIFWLKRFENIVRYIDKVIKGYKTFSPSRMVVKKFLEQNIMENWNKSRFFDYAKIKIDEWESLTIKDKNQRVKEIIEQPPNLQSICILSKEWLKNPTDFETNNCLRKIIGNLMVIEKHLEKDGATLETDFLDRKYFPLHLIHIIKSIFRRQQMASRRSLNFNLSPYSKAMKIHEIRAANIKCLDELRERYDREHLKLSKLLREEHLQQCLNDFINKAESADDSVKNLYLRQTHAGDKKNVINAEKDLIKSMMRSYHKMKPLQPAIQNLVNQGLPQDPLAYPWANQFINSWETSTIPDKYAKLDNAFYSNSISLSSSTSCKKTNSMDKKKCWNNYLTQNAMVESHLQKDGVSLEYVYLGDPFRMNLIYSIDDALKRKQQEQSRVITQFRIAADPLAEIDDGLLDQLAEEEIDVVQDTNSTLAELVSEESYE
ncbi:uncharacterized protein [Chelonus insularis]|uniref:uncharacterized protein isoform X1 n=1 Tax=Chelonus insularis TaxID=460826 RepID=UPI00158AE5F1|nr:uncharacterized protein LOC118065984 isoform X1 [Chelonus insularis]